MLSWVEGASHPLGCLLCTRGRSQVLRHPCALPEGDGARPSLTPLGLPSCDPAPSLPLSLFLFYF